MTKLIEKTPSSVFIIAYAVLGTMLSYLLALVTGVGAVVYVAYLVLKYMVYTLPKGIIRKIRNHNNASRPQNIEAVQSEMNSNNLRQQVERKIDSMDEKNFPVLCGWRKANRDWLVDNILQATHGDAALIGTTMANYESDLE